MDERRKNQDELDRKNVYEGVYNIDPFISRLQYRLYIELLAERFTYIVYILYTWFIYLIHSSYTLYMLYTLDVSLSFPSHKWYICYSKSTESVNLQN